MKKLLLFCLTILAFCGWSMPTGWQYPSLTIGFYSTTNQTLTSAQSGTILMLNGANNNTQVTLPSATPGLDFVVISNVAKYFAMIPQASDIIAFSSNTAGQGVQNSSTGAVGDSIELVCVQGGYWSVKQRTGTWAQGI